MVTKKALLEEIKNKYNKDELKIVCKDLVKGAESLSKRELINQLSKFKVSELESVLNPAVTEEKLVKLSFKPNKWTIPAISLAVLTIILTSGVLNYTQPVQQTIITFLVDGACTDCYDVTVNEGIVESYGVSVETITYDVSSTEGQALIALYNIIKIPAFIIEGDEAFNNADLVSAWQSVGTIESDGAMVFRAPEFISDDYEIFDGVSFSMYEPPVQTIGNFIVTEDDLCVNDNGKPIIYFFGSSSCPHCAWEHPIINNVTALFGDEIEYHDNFNTQDDSEVFANYLEINKGGVPFMIIGCQFVRVGSGESAISDNSTINYFINNSVVNDSLVLYDEALNYYAQAYAAYLANQSYDGLFANYTALIKEASTPIEELVLTELICNVTNGLPSSVCD
ncbi:MAG: thioredoxin family protein [Candidatus Nanoarchaeia archaeon]|jgi:thiol-disulfide isomerase/thioredoxin